MAIKSFKPYTPSRRNMTVSAFDGVDKKAKPERSLLETVKKNAGRNSYGRITVRHRGGGNKRKYRIIDFRRDKLDMPATVQRIEYDPGRGAQLVRSAGDYAQLMAKDAQFAQVRLPSGEVRLVRPNCVAVIGQVGNIDHENVHIGKAGRTRHMGFRPTVRGSVMNPNDHPHGGGEGKSPVGHPGPMTPWGKPAMGLKTRKTKNRTNKYIFKHRNAK